MDIHYGPGGAKTIVRRRADSSVVVSNRLGYGHIEHPYSYRGATFVQRTYYVNKVSYVRIYQPYPFGGVGLSVYAPAYYYPAPFYGWVYNGWGAPVPYGWGWAGDPWYGYYGGYFTPYPVYATPSLGLTDYMLAQTLQEAYLTPTPAVANVDASFTPITPPIKQQIADEVRRQINLENSEARAGAQTPPEPGSSGIARMLSDNTAHVFVVSDSLVVQSNAGECSITEGDVLRLSVGALPDSSTANLVVLASKGQNECQKGSTVMVGFVDLQEMQNHMRETIDQGLADLQKEQGRNGIPAAPPFADAPPVQTKFAALAPPPDPNVATELSAQAREGGQAEQEVLNQTGPGGPNIGANPEPVAPSDFRGSCSAIKVLDLMQNAPNNWKADLSAPLNQIQSQGINAYIRDQGGILELLKTTRRDLASERGKRSAYGIDLNQAWIDLLVCMSPRVSVPVGPRTVGSSSDAGGSGAGLSDGIYRIGNGVSSPALLYKIEPRYPEEARLAGLQGTVLLYAQVDPSGRAVNIHVRRGLGMGLDESAIEAVKMWKFAPGLRDGNPVTVEAHIDVNFRLR
jgi:TonB family protein